MKMTLRISILIPFLTFVPFQFSLAIDRIRLRDVRASFIGEDEDHHSGSVVCIAGDVNGDGYDDILIRGSGKRTDYMRSYAGQTYLIFGKPDGWAMRTSLSEADASFVGENHLDSSGYWLSGVGDINGDGYDDFLIGARYNDQSAKDAGQTYLIFGKPDGWAMRTSLSDVDASFVGEEREDWSGVTLSGAGDVNGDGYDDFLIGSFTFGPDFPDIKDHIGRVYLIFGKPDGWAMRTSLSEADVIYYGPVSKDWSGLALAGAGDVNSDGCDDFLIAAHWKDENWIDVSKVYLIFGTPEGWEKRVPMSESNVTFVASGWFAISGSWGLQHSWSVSGAGDVNGDGYDDILIGAAWDEEGGKEAGQTYLVFGRPGGLGGHVEIDILQGADASFIGEHPGYWSGFRVCGGADVNGDGYDDILIGASWSGHGGARAGETYLIYGKPNGWTKGVNLSQADISFLGEEPGDRSDMPSPIPAM